MIYVNTPHRHSLVRNEGSEALPHYVLTIAATDTQGRVWPAGTPAQPGSAGKPAPWLIEELPAKWRDVQSRIWQQRVLIHGVEVAFMCAGDR